MKLKTIASILVLLMLVSVFCSCTKGVNLSDRAIVKMLFIDKIKDDYIAGAIIYKCEPTSDAGQANDVAQIFFGTGKTISGALQQATKQQNNKPFYAQNEILVLGKNATNDIENILTYFSREEASRPNMAVFVSDLTAEKLGEAEQLVTVVENIEGIIKNKDQTFMFAKMIYQCDFRPNGFCGGITKIKLSKQDNIEICGLQMFENGKPVELFKMHQTQIVLLLQNKALNFHIAKSLNDKKFECDISNIKRYTNVVTNRDGEKVVQIIISGVVRNLAFENSINAISDEEKKQAKLAVTSMLTKQCNTVIDSVSKITSSDIFGTRWWHTLYTTTEVNQNTNQVDTQVIFDISFL